MRITNFDVYGLAQSLVASGLPMVEEYDPLVFEQEVYAKENRERVFKRVCNLASTDSNSGHCNFLTGIVVQFNITATQAFFLQAHRYHWWQVVSSMSKMHRLGKMLDKGTAQIHCRTLTRPADSSDLEELIYSCPMGLETTERVSTNYLQLRTIYNQRKDHRLTEWRNFCEWIKTLPMAKELILGEVEENG